MDFENEMPLVKYLVAIGNLVLHLLWLFLHFVVSLLYIASSMAKALESYLISLGLIKRYKSLNIHKLRYLAVAVESEDAREISKVVELLRWLKSIGVKNVCLFDSEGLLKKSKKSIVGSLKGARLFEETDENESLPDKDRITLEVISFSDGKEAIAKAANVLFQKYSKLCDPGRNQGDQMFTEAHMTEALRAIGCRGPEPDLLLVYGPVRCHLGFPAWRIRYTEIVHMGPLRSMRYGLLIKAIYKFTMVRQNYGT